MCVKSIPLFQIRAISEALHSSLSCTIKSLSIIQHSLHWLSILSMLIFWALQKHSSLLLSPSYIQQCIHLIHSLPQFVCQDDAIQGSHLWTKPVLPPEPHGQPDSQRTGQRSRSPHPPCPRLSPCAPESQTQTSAVMVMLTKTKQMSNDYKHLILFPLK